MKKIVSLLMTIMLCTTLLAGCGNKLTAAAVQKDANKQLRTSVIRTVNTITKQAQKEENIALAKSLTEGNGSYELQFTVPEGSLTGTINVDRKAKKSSSDFKISASGVELAASLFTSNKEIAAKCSPFTGNGYLGLDLSTAKEDVKTASFWQLLGGSYENLPDNAKNTINMVIDAINTAMENSGNLKDEDISSFLDATGKIVQEMKTTSEEKKINLHGEECNTIALTYHVTAEDIKKIADAYMVLYGKMMDNSFWSGFLGSLSTFKGATESEIGLDSVVSTMSESIKEAIDQIMPQAELTFYLIPDTQNIASFTLSVKAKANEADTLFSLEAVLGKDPEKSPKYTFDCKAGVGDVSSSVKLTFDREVSSNTVKGKITGEGIASFSANYEFQSEKKGDFKYSIRDITAGGKNQNVALSFSYSSDAKVEAMPEYKNIFKMSQEDIMSFMQGIQGMF